MVGRGRCHLFEEGVTPTREFLEQLAAERPQEVWNQNPLRIAAWLRTIQWCTSIQYTIIYSAPLNGVITI